MSAPLKSFSNDEDKCTFVRFCHIDLGVVRLQLRMRQL